MKKKLLLILSLNLVLMLSVLGQVATNGDYRSAVATGNWGTLATWEVRTAGAWAIATSLPVATSNVYIQQGHSITVNIVGAVCQDLQLNATSGVLTLGVNNLNVNGKLRGYTSAAAVTGAADGTFYTQANNSSPTATMITSSSGYLRFVGNTRTITASTDWGASGTTGIAIEFALTAGQIGTVLGSIKAKDFIFSSGTISATARIAPDNGGPNSGTATIMNGATLISNQSGTGTGNQVFSRTGTSKCLQVAIQSGGTLELTGADPRIDVTSFSNNGNVIYSRSGPQNLLQRSGNDLTVATQFTNYFNLNIKTAGAKTLPSNYAITIAAGGSFTENGDATCILASASGNITNMASTGGGSPVATVTTAVPHNFTVGQIVTVAAVTPFGTTFNGTVTIASIPTATTFTYTALNATVVASQAATSGTVTGIPCSLNYGAGATFFSSSTSNITLTASSLEWPATNSPNNVTVTANTLAFTPNLAAFQVTSYSLIANVATINTTAPHGFIAGSVVTITNVFPCDTLFNGTYTLLSGSGTTMTYSLISPYTIPLETATAPFGAVTNAPLTRTIPGILTLNGGGFNIGSGNKLIMANGSTVMRSSTLAGSQLTVNSGFYSVGAASTDLVNIEINANGTVIGSSEMSNSPSPGGFGNLTITNTATYETSGARKIVNLINAGNLVLKPTTTSTFTVYGSISGVGLVTSGNNNASITIGVAGTPSIGTNTGNAGTINFNQTTPGVTNAFNNFKIDRVVNPAGTPSITFNGSVSFKGNYNQSNGIVNLSAGATLTLTGTASSSSASLRGNSTANIIITGTGSLGTLFFDQTTPGTTNLFKDFTLNRTALGTATLGSDVIFGGATTLTNGSLNIASAVTLEIAGSFTNNSGTGTIGGAADNTTSNLPYLTVSGSGATFNALKFTNGFTEFKNFVASRSASIDATAGNGLRIQSNLNLNNSSTTLTTNDNVTLRSTIVGTARVLSVSGITNPFVGSFTVERYIPANANRAWRLLSLPTNTTQSFKQAWQNGQVGGVQGPAGAGTWITSKLSSTWNANGFDGYSPNNNSLLKFNNVTGGWDGITTPTTDPIATNGGYMLFVRGDRSIQGMSGSTNATTLSSKGPLRVGNYPAIPIVVNANKYEVIGNPYASAIDLRNITISGGTDKVFYVWDPKLLPYGAYQTLTFSNLNSYYEITPGGGSYGANGTRMDTIASGQAFIARATGIAGTVQFTEASKTAGTRSVFRPVTANKEQRLFTNLYAVNTNNLDLVDGTMNVYDNTYSAAVDGNDAKKLVNFNENLGMLRDGQTLAVEKSPIIGITDTIFYDLRKPIIRKYKFEFIATNLNHPNLLGKLEDAFLKTSIPVNLDGTTTYDFSVTADTGSYARNRFRVVIYQSGATPVNMIKIGATALYNNQVSIDWKMLNQINISKYEVERSADSNHFINKTSQLSTGENGETIGYNWIDRNAFVGENFYRIKYISTTGSISYSSIVKVKVSKGGQAINIYPSLISCRTINLQLNDIAKGNYTVLLVNNSGQVLLTKKLFHNTATTSYAISVERTVSNGNYTVQIIKPDGRKTILPIVIID